MSKYVMSVFRIEKNILKCYARRFCSKNLPTLFQEEKSKKKADILEEATAAPTSLITDSSEECAKLEERAAKQVLIEKEQDANLQSRVSKECRVLFTAAPGQSTSIKVGAIRVDNKLNLQKDSIDWLSYNFDQVGGSQAAAAQMNKGKDDQSKPAQSIEKSTGVTQAGGSGGGISASLRPKRGEPGKVLLTFIPEEWWLAFMPKTGVTGFGTFLVTFATFLVSKEYYVLEHNYYNGLSSLILWACGIKYLGPQVAKWLDKEVDAYEKSWNSGRVQQKEALEEAILDEIHLQYQMAGQLMLIDVKRENVLLQLEEEYRNREMYVYSEVVRRLDYHVAQELVRQRVQHRNLIEYVTREVIKAITPEMQDKLIYYSIDRIMQDLGKDNEKK